MTKRRWEKIVLRILVLICCVLLVYVGWFLTMAFQFGSGCGNWNTERIVFRHRENPNDRIEFQYQDCGVLGGNGRTVRIREGAYWKLQTLVQIDTIAKADWISDTSNGADMKIIY